jgi:DNA-directed RNA polymerase specialized sigma24 family protein
MAGPRVQLRSSRALIDACRADAASFRSGAQCANRSCFELVRRAICDRDEVAWEAVIAQYRDLVLSWVRRHPAAATALESDDYWLTLTFERFWTAVGPERFRHFDDLGSVLRYLKMCAHSVLVDELRARRRQAGEPLDEASGQADDGANLEATVTGRLARRELWLAIARTLPDEPSRLAIYCSFALDMKPSEISARYPQHYQTVADVYRVKRRALDRLRRDAEIQAGYAPVASAGRPGASGRARRQV